jgi:hypothetical protein
MAKLLECVECKAKFSLKALKTLKFFVSTLVCLACYKRAAKDQTTCFGKEYDKHSPVCTQICPDSKVCRHFVRLGQKDEKEK